LGTQYWQRLEIDCLIMYQAYARIDAMTKVIVIPGEIEFEAQPGETVMGAANARGLYWPTTCGGQGICTTCLSEVLEGADFLVGMGRSERKTLVAERGEAILRRPVRLVCQAIVLEGDTIKIAKPGVRGQE
jgi:2Fe-2S ferredoxin